jgi:DNA sulfur modification protein DndB
MKITPIHLPCLRGNFGNWNYFSTVIRVKDIVTNNRIITVPESRELYTKNINQILQREIETSRIKRIKGYLLQNEERFFSSLIVAIHKGDPKWADFDLERQFRIDNEEQLKDEEVEFIENKIGVLSLSGSEEIFVLDGQHRLLGIRKAFEENPAIGNDEISVIIVIHKSELKERTRRLFTVLNRYAVAIKPAEKVILEEDDAAAILTRRLVQSHPIFLQANAISTTKQFNLSSSDVKSFTTLVCLYEIVKELVNYKTLYRSKVLVRPSETDLDNLYKDKILPFWDGVFEKFPELVEFIKGESTASSFVRNKQNGGSLLLRPEGQLLMARIYAEMEKKGEALIFLDRISKIDLTLNSGNWNYVFWKGDRMEPKYKKLKYSILNHLLGRSNEQTYIEREMKKIYTEHNLAYTFNLTAVSE